MLKISTCLQRNNEKETEVNWIIRSSLISIDSLAGTSQVTAQSTVVRNAFVYFFASYLLVFGGNISVRDNHLYHPDGHLLPLFNIK